MIYNPPRSLNKSRRHPDITIHIGEEKIEPSSAPGWGLGYVLDTPHRQTPPPYTSLLVFGELHTSHPDLNNFPCGRDILCRVSVDQHHVGEHALADGPTVTEPKGLGGQAGGGVERVDGGHAGLDEVAALVVQAGAEADLGRAATPGVGNSAGDDANDELLAVTGLSAMAPKEPSTARVRPVWLPRDVQCSDDWQWATMVVVTP